MFSWYTQTSWKEYYLNDDAENVHARVYKSARAQVAVVSFRGTQAGLPGLLPSIHAVSSMYWNWLAFTTELKAK